MIKIKKKKIIKYFYQKNDIYNFKIFFLKKNTSLMNYLNLKLFRLEALKLV
jgi:hypothetical protein